MNEEIDKALDEKSLQVLSNEKEESQQSTDRPDLIEKPRPDSNGWIDQLQQKVISRKLLVFATATALLIWAGLDANTWGMIAMCYIGGQSAIDFAKVWKGGGF